MRLRGKERGWRRASEPAALNRFRVAERCSGGHAPHRRLGDIEMGLGWGRLELQALKMTEWTRSGAVRVVAVQRTMDDDVESQQDDRAKHRRCRTKGGPGR